MSVIERMPIDNGFAEELADGKWDQGSHICRAVSVLLCLSKAFQAILVEDEFIWLHIDYNTEQNWLS